MILFAALPKGYLSFIQVLGLYKQGPVTPVTFSLFNKKHFSLSKWQIMLLILIDHL